jgi:hypothetical protein
MPGSIIMVPEKFVNSLAGWHQKLENDEWYFCNLREEIVSALSPENSFKSIKATLEFATNHDEEFIVIEAIELALHLINKSGTTEMPTEIEKVISNLQNHLFAISRDSGYAQSRLSEVKKWYRIKSI